MFNIMKMTGKIVALFFLITICLPYILFANTVYLKDGRKIEAEEYEISDGWFRIIEKGELTREFPLENVVKVVKKDGTELNPAAEEKTPVKTEKKKKRTILTWDKEVDGLLTPFPFSLSYSFSAGYTAVSIYNRDESEVAKGEASFIQNKFSFSSEEFNTNIFLSPELGFFQRKLNVKDFSKKSRVAGDNIIPGIITNPDTGEVIPQEDVYSLKYEAEFNTFFLDLKAGGQLVFTWGYYSLNLNGYLFGNLAEYRRSKFTFKAAGKSEEFSSPFDFSYLNSYGFGGGFGFYFENLRTGITTSFEKRYLKRFDLPPEIRFKQSYYDSQFQTTRARETTAEYSDIDANLFILRIYFML